MFFAPPESAIDPIDKEMQKRLDTGRAMLYAFGWAETEWDKAMNTAYTALMKRLPARQKALLQASQREWIRYRDREFALMDDLLNYGQTVPGSTSNPEKLAVGSDRVALVKSRALMLRHYEKMPYRLGSGDKAF